MRSHLGMTVLSFVLAVGVALPASAQCTRTEAIAAENEAGYLKSWTEVYASYQRFAHCDDGSIGKRYSGSVVRLLADQWQGLPELNRLVSGDRGFEQFVLKHVDQFMSRDQETRIEKNARTRCSRSARPLCKAIIERLESVRP